ncbi:unnamed protein product [Cylindrotheca closterium]|uniref:Uncharacterized protein n=1 Tax=Cylindrotheca closterium TaxID=2856 RepID=A0AAD2FFT6_9STRA|nr:unnamed protein product [Cylindrotheca closterium]
MSDSAETELEMKHRNKSGGGSSLSSLPMMQVEDELLSDSIRIQETSKGFLTPVVWSILACEAAERFAYFGFRAILVLYFKNALQLSETTAIALFAYVASLAYFSPIIGALLADGSWGRYRTIIRFASLYLVGLAILTVGAFLHSNYKQGGTDSSVATELSESELFQKRATTFTGLFFVCIGTGGIKPCVSAFGADQVASQSKGNESHDDNTEHAADEGPSSSLEVQAFFAYFYFCINLGALTSIFLVPIVKARYGFGFAFLAPTIFLFFALVAFLSKRKEYVHHVPGQRGSLGSMFWLCGLLLHERIKEWWRSPQSDYQSIQPSPRTSPPSVEQSNEWTAQQLEDANRTLQILPVLSMLPIFWMLYDQQGSVWTLQASRMHLTFGIEPEQMNVINPVEILLFIPLFDKCIYPSIERLMGRPFTHLSRMAWGMLFCAISFFVSGVLESVLQAQAEANHDDVDSDSNGNGNGKSNISILWQLPQITLLSIAEILLSVTGYDFCYSNSSSSCKALIMALFLMTTAGGDFFAGILYNGLFQDMNRATVMHVCGGLMMLNLLLFLRVAKWWNQCQAELQMTGTLLTSSGGDEVSMQQDEGMGGRKSDVELT